MCKPQYILYLVYLSTYHLSMYLLGSVSLKNFDYSLDLKVFLEKKNIEDEFTELILRILGLTF